MFNLFNRKETIIKLHQDLPPAERIGLLFYEQLAPVLSTYDFTFVNSKTLFKKKVGEFTQEIHISKSKWNRGNDVCRFWLVFSVTADKYNDWHLQKYGVLPINNVVTGFYHNHLKDWATQYPLDKYDLAKQDNQKIFEEIQANVTKLVLPLLNRYSDYEQAADTFMQKQEYWWVAKVVDFYLIAGKEQKAKHALQVCKEYLEKNPEGYEDKLNEVKLRERVI